MFPCALSGPRCLAIAGWGVRNPCPGTAQNGRGQDQLKVNCTVQEAGLKALRKAVDLLEADARDVPARAGFGKYVLYISDAYAWDANFEDFSTFAAATTFKERRASSLPGLKFYSSVSTQDATYSTPLTNPTAFVTPILENGQSVYADEYIEKRVGFVHPVSTQMTQFAATSGVPGKALAYPFVRSVFEGEFSEHITTSTQAATLGCAVTQAKIIDSQGSTLLNVDPVTSAFEASALPQGALGLRLQIERCCKLPGDTSCKETTSSDVALNLMP